MPNLRIRTFGDPVLRERAREIDHITDLHRGLIANMIDTMRDAPGVGLAAPQVGVLERIFVWEVDEEYGAVINPVITGRSRETEIDAEGCLSLPGLVYPVERATAVTLEGIDENGAPVHFEAEGLQAVVFQHEVDHLDGVLFIDHLPEELRREALASLRDQALGIVRPPVAEVAPADGGDAF
ncbi:MAG TPA: peptide deformylase [Actinomycetota bacterium]|nr:peptide deformylase [Actinomycetota bacterium]